MHALYIWYNNKADLNSPGTIHQILAYGNLRVIRDIKRKLGEKKLKEVFLKFPQKIYTPSVLNFVKKFILRIYDPLDERKYLKTTLRHTG